MKAKPLIQTTEALALRREAASLGPGLHGQRKEGSATERAIVRERLEALGLDSPIYLEQEQTWVDRKAKLFEVGEYKDKGVTVSNETLATLATSFDLPVPVLIEHANNPLELGYLTSVDAKGGELFGTVSLSKEANDLIERSGAHSLSLGLSSDMASIQEVSLVKKPRIASARLFTGTVFASEPDWQAEYEALARRHAEEGAKSVVERLIAEGRIVPAQVPFAMALIREANAIQFDGDSVPVSKIALALLECAPCHTLFKEHAPQGAGSPAISPDEKQFYDRYFAGLSLEEIAKNRKP